MFYISEIQYTAPAEYKTELQEVIYTTLQKLRICFERVDTDEVISIEDCIPINRKLDMKMVKTLFLCNRQKTDFYLFITTADKLFRAKELSAVINIPHLSFAPVDLFEKMLGTKVGAATIFSVILDKNNHVQVLLDKDVVSEEYYGCSDGTTRGYMKIKTASIVNYFLDFAKTDSIFGAIKIERMSIIIWMTLTRTWNPSVRSSTYRSQEKALKPMECVAISQLRESIGFKTAAKAVPSINAATMVRK